MKPATGLLALLVLAATTGVHASPQLKLSHQALLLYRVLSYDRKVARLPGESVPVALVFRAGSAASEDMARHMNHELLRIPARLGGKRFIPALLPFADGASFAARVQVMRPVAFYLCDGLDADLEELLHQAREISALTMSASEPWARGGVSVAFVVRDDSAKLLINLSSARAEGSELDAAMLRLAEVVR
jgi:hypothetical protein